MSEVERAPSSVVVPSGTVTEPTDGQGIGQLAQHNAWLNQAVQERLDAAVERNYFGRISEGLPNPADYAMYRLTDDISAAVGAQGYDPDMVKVVQPPNNAATAGVDLAFNIMRAARAAQTDPSEAASAIQQQLDGQELLSGVETTGAFVNMALDYERLAPQVLAEVAATGEHYGHVKAGPFEVVVIDYSSPNVAKHMTVAHLRSTIIGESLKHLQAATGKLPFAVNHIGDWGAQFGNIIHGYQAELAARGQEFLDELNADPTGTLLRIYRDFELAKDDHPEMVQSAREIFHQLEQGDPELVELWMQFREWSLSEFDPVYRRLGVEFDAFQGESFYEDRMPTVIQEALEAGVLVRNDEGAIVFPSQPLTDPLSGETNEQIMFDKDGNPRDEVIVKPNGGTVYLTRDLAAIAYRKRDLKADRILYVIGKEQQAHCLMLFNIAHQMGIAALGEAVHVSFGHLNVEGRKMKSRGGKVVFLKDLLDEATEAAGEYLQERNDHTGEPLTSSEQQTAEQVGVGALVFNDLQHDRRGDIEFDPDVARAVEAGGVIYVQYSNSRLLSILERQGQPVELTTIPELTDIEKSMLLQIAQLPLVVREAAESYAPHRLAGYLNSFCKLVNSFYTECPVGQAEEDVRNFRLHLVKASQQVIANSAKLLHLNLPERM